MKKISGAKEIISCGCRDTDADCYFYDLPNGKRIKLCQSCHLILAGEVMKQVTYEALM